MYPSALNEPDALQGHPRSRRSLAPHRVLATPIDSLSARLLGDATDSSLGRVFAQGMTQTAGAVDEHFPDNIFADVDFLAAALLAQAHRDPDPAACLAGLFDRIASLIELYGCHSAINFRYVHDFLYGFDWARWARKDPRRRRVGPFDLEFLAYLQRRGAELLALIAADDSQYPRLAPGRWRNPFGISREPDEETHLHRELATAGLVPVTTWDIAARPSCDQDFSKLRQERATRLYG